MGSSERTQGWFPKQFDYGMYLLGDPLDKVRKFQTHVVRLAMETDMWAARCRMIHSGRTTSASSRKVAMGEYAAALLRTGRKDLPITKRMYMELSVKGRGGNDAAMGGGLPNGSERPPVRVDHLHSGASKTRAAGEIGEAEGREH